MTSIGNDAAIARLPQAGWSGDVKVGPRGLPGRLSMPAQARGVIVFAHGSGSSRNSPRNIHAAERLQEARFGTLLFDLLTDAEARDRGNVFDIPMLAGRVVEAVDWLCGQQVCAGLPIGLFGASTGAAAAIVAATARPETVRAIVSRGGRPDLANAVLDRLRAPTLLIVGGADTQTRALNWRAMLRMGCEADLTIIANAGHLFEEPGALQEALSHAVRWFERHLRTERPS
jgi:pimeloyl-ACP methyl ester carboxylesterase